MELGYIELNELLNLFGVSLRLEGSNAFFYDTDTNLQMTSHVYFEHLGKEFTSDVTTLFNGYPFYLGNETKKLKLNILIREKNIRVYEITKKEEIEPHLYEEYSLRGEWKSFVLDEDYYRADLREDGTEYPVRKEDCLSSVKFVADKRQGGWMLVDKDKKWAELSFEKNKETGEVTFDFHDCGPEETNQQEVFGIIEQSGKFKDILNVCFPKLANKYSSVKSNDVMQMK